MAPNDYCRLCKTNMREAGPSVFGHSTDMFLTKKTTSISERLALLGVIVVPELGQSNRCCQHCSSVISRLEKDLPIFRQWEQDFRDSSASERQREPTPSKTPRDLKKTCPNPPSPSARFFGETARVSGARSFGETTTQVTIKYPSQILTRVCDPEEDPIVKFIVLRRWKEAASHIMKHPHLQDEVKHGVIKLIRKECDLLCSPKNDFLLWKCTPADLKSFSFYRLRDDLHRLAPFLLSIFNCISNDNNFAGCTAAAIAIRGRQPRLAALSFWINTILQYGGAKKSVFSRLSQLSITTSHSRAIKKQQLALDCGAEFLQFQGTKSNDESSPDYTPSVNMGYHAKQVNSSQQYARQDKFINNPQLRESLGFTQKRKFQLVRGAVPEILKPTRATVDSDVAGQRGRSSACVKLQVARQKRSEGATGRNILKTFETAATLQRDDVEKPLQTSVHFHDYFQPLEEETNSTGIGVVSETNQEMQINFTCVEHTDVRCPSEAEKQDTDSPQTRRDGQNGCPLCEEKTGTPVLPAEFVVNTSYQGRKVITPGHLIMCRAFSHAQSHLQNDKTQKHCRSLKSDKT
ncbi:uncharacterized protein LOC132894265 isoform X3 [Neoarius graeffei]|uniref:uncharacterized protein LOC132894265 isoform X3 n=1 Tax=Neoarius graeffei TaxID=443677 RepID=UPI00298C0C9B|nr:uncharacterized protein LOC132894265 isoform X3 [Neoarius graeffei]